MIAKRYIGKIAKAHREKLKDTIINDIDRWTYSLLVNEDTKVKCANGTSLYINPSDFVVSRRIWREGEFQPYLGKYISNELNVGDIAIDVGANIGYFTILMGSIVGDSGKVYAFEPAEKNVRVLNKNVETNDLTEVVEVRSEAASDQNGTADLSIATFNKGSHSIAEAKESEKVVKVPTIKIDDVVVNDVDLIKIDAEGSEDKVIAGMEHILSEHTPIVILEYNPQLWERNTKEALQPLFKAGLSPYEVRKNGETIKISIQEILERSFTGDIVFKP